MISEQDEQKNISNRTEIKRFIKKKVCILLVIAFVIITVLLFFVFNIYHKPGLYELLARAKLAKFPSSIKNLQVETRHDMNDGRPSPITSEMYVRFEAEPNDIDNFINNSPGIDKNRIRPLVPLPDDGHVPTWWPTDQTTSGQMYVIHDRRDISVMITVYDDSNTVRIFMWYVVNPWLLDMKEDIEDLHDAFEDFIDDMLREVLDLFD